MTESWSDVITQRFRESAEVLRRACEALGEPLQLAARAIVDSLRGGGTVFLFGNGGSAADAQHIAGELVGRFLRERPGVRAVALSTDTSIMTAVGNDYGFDAIFARQLDALGRSGDVAIALSTSGNSGNILAGLESARRLGMKTVAFTGPGGGRCAELADVLLAVPGDALPSCRVQEAHSVLYHVLCELVERELFPQ